MKQRRVGRPPKWETREDLITEINNYFDATPFEEYSVTGLALAMGTSKQLLIDYENREGFSDIIKEAKLLIEHSYELSLRKNGRTGDIFALKNFNWKDKTETDVTSKGESITGINYIVPNGNNTTTDSQAT